MKMNREDALTLREMSVDLIKSVPLDDEDMLRDLYNQIDKVVCHRQRARGRNSSVIASRIIEKRGQMVTTAEAAAILGLSEYTVRKYCREGRIPARIIGSSYRISVDVLEQIQKEGI